ncbi:hypothetical protein CMO83_01470 [Candidatus Woesearchaeota archaeon]|jgi:uncharacterized paraquat-inducible protein A|nr:hypothetical protein [Candidatus Woesearchaeota archaeon]MDP6647982.1 zinc ribbon domain-containing protein [Candidatus Woesearchaeota archaeon]|tara:strand:+ start:22439 stop:22717 length:279 start_codon:yes stop_codon:yes gene_type:complete
MAKIHGLVYIVVGLFVSIASLRIDYGELYLFFYVGIIFIVVGSTKLVNKYLENQDKKLHKAKHHAHRLKYCHNCRNVIRTNDKFCNKCGVRA